MVLVAIDNDECIGSWGEASVLFMALKDMAKRKRRRVCLKLFVRILEAGGCLRPGLRYALDTILALKRAKIITGVYMFTAAQNAHGWVSFLRKALEKWYGRKIYDGVIHQELIRDWHDAHGTPFMDAVGSVNKDMDLLRHMTGQPDVRVVVLDDRPENISNGHAIGVTPYQSSMDVSTVGSTLIPGWNAEVEALVLACLGPRREPPSADENPSVKDVSLFTAVDALRTLLLSP